MVTTPSLHDLARQHLAPHFTRAAVWQSQELPVIVRGEGCYVFDEDGHRYLDGLAGLFCVNIGHGRDDIVDAAATQMRTLAYATNWSAVHPASIGAAKLIADLAPGDLDIVFFVNSGSEAVESAIKFARQYHRSRGDTLRTKIIAREMAYHGTTLGALSVTGLPAYKEPFMPLLAGVRHVPNTLHAALPPGGAAKDLACVQAIEAVINEEGPETIAALFAEPVQNGRGALVPPDGYWQELRAICDKYGILLVADEVICGFGRLGYWFGSEMFSVVPDLITFAKGSTSGYVPLGGLLIRKPLMDVLVNSPAGMFTHGATWGGHPVATAVACANLNALHDEQVLENVCLNAPGLRDGLDRLLRDHSSVREIRGAGYFYAIELTADRDTDQELSREQSSDLLRQVLPAAMREASLITRPDDRGATMIMVAPPLVADSAIIGELLGQLDFVLAKAENYIHSSAREGQTGIAFSEARGERH